MDKSIPNPQNSSKKRENYSEKAYVSIKLHTSRGTNMANVHIWKVLWRHVKTENSPLFALFVLFAIRDYSLFGFSRHPLSIASHAQFQCNFKNSITAILTDNWKLEKLFPFFQNRETNCPSYIISVLPLNPMRRFIFRWRAGGVRYAKGLSYLTTRTFNNLIYCLKRKTAFRLRTSFVARIWRRGMKISVVYIVAR